MLCVLLRSLNVEMTALNISSHIFGTETQYFISSVPWLLQQYLIVMLIAEERLL